MNQLMNMHLAFMLRVNKLSYLVVLWTINAWGQVLHTFTLTTAAIAADKNTLSYRITELDEHLTHATEFLIQTGTLHNSDTYHNMTPTWNMDDIRQCLSFS